jgi:hypothetical protein
MGLQSTTYLQAYDSDYQKGASGAQTISSLIYGGAAAMLIPGAQYALGLLGGYAGTQGLANNLGTINGQTQNEYGAYEIKNEDGTTTMLHSNEMYWNIAGNVFLTGVSVLPLAQQFKGSLGLVDNEIGAIGNISKTKIDILKENQLKGKAFEQITKTNVEKVQNNVVEQITLETKSGVKTRIDILGTDKTTGVVCGTECKASAAAKLTENQKVALPEIAESGATVKGKGKAPFVGGTKIPPTTIKVVRPE